MAISDDLFRAILAMDSYNRGYNAGIGDPVTGLPGTQIGNATINNTPNPAGYQAAGFFAQSYTWAGKTVISYRGTDNLYGNLSSLFTNGDIWNGYGVGAGSPQGKQAELALNFYKSVAGAGVDPRTANIELTGHSLGGGLARVNPSVPDQVRA
jgi:hypothetical protein